MKPIFLLPLIAGSLAPTAILLSQRADAQTLQRTPQIRPMAPAPDWKIIESMSGDFLRVDSKSGTIQNLIASGEKIPNPSGVGNMPLSVWTSAKEGKGIAIPEPGAVGRYQFVKGNNNHGEIIRFDTVTGKMWVIYSTKGVMDMGYYPTK
jgi:hypothetical protein